MRGLRASECPLEGLRNKPSFSKNQNLLSKTFRNFWGAWGSCIWSRWDSDHSPGNRYWLQSSYHYLQHHWGSGNGTFTDTKVGPGFASVIFTFILFQEGVIKDKTGQSEKTEVWSRETKQASMISLTNTDYGAITMNWMSKSHLEQK